MNVEPGQIWRDMDRRTKGRLRVVLSVTDGKAQLGDLEGTFRKTWISLDRFYKHSKGFELVHEKAYPQIVATVLEHANV